MTHGVEDSGVEKAYTLYLENLLRGPYGPLPAEYDGMRFSGATLDSDEKVLPSGRLAELRVQAAPETGYRPAQIGSRKSEQSES